MTTPLLKIVDLQKAFNGLRAIDGFSCSIGKGEIIGLIGPNGAGKTTLFNVLTGFATADNGAAFFAGKNLLKLTPQQISCLGLSRTFQNRRLIKQLSVLDNVMLALKDLKNEKVFRAIFQRTRLSISETRNREEALRQLSETGLADMSTHKAEFLSYGQQKLLNLVMCMASGAQLVLLDEPIAGIDLSMRQKILKIISESPKQGKTVVFIEHDIEAVMDVCTRLVFMDEGKKIREGLPDDVRNAPEVIDAYLK